MLVLILLGAAVLIGAYHADKVKHFVSDVHDFFHKE